MTDLDRIREIEETLGFKLHCVPLDELKTAHVFARYSDKKHTRNYSVDAEGNVMGLALDISPIHLLENQLLRHFRHVEQLSLKNAHTPDYSFLKEMHSLISLDLSRNDLTDVSFLKEMKAITSLDLSENQLTDVSFLKEMKAITALHVSFNPLTDVSFLKEMKAITALHLSFNPLTDFSFLKEMHSLISLDLSRNSLTDVSFLKEMKAITSLDLSDNQLTDVSFLKEMKVITSLNLRSNKLTDVSFLKEMKAITSLDLRSNQLTDVSFLKEMKAITSLDLRSNKLTDVSFLKEMKAITSLNLRNNQLTDVSFLKEMKAITSLDLSFNKLTDVSFLKEMKAITNLDLSSNQLTDVSFLKEMKAITSLNLRNNQIQSIPKELLQHPLEIEVEESYKSNCINLTDNPITTPPLEIVKQGRQAMLDYYTQKDLQGEEVMYEAKVVILGEAGAGKTTLFKKLQDTNLLLPDTSSTLGVQVKEGLLLPHPQETDKQLVANLWDFGGQEVQYQLHQYFITPESLYIIVADNRKQNTRWAYWLQVISLLGGACPVIVVLNDNEYTGKDNFPFNDCQEHFPDLQLERQRLNFAVNDGNWGNLQVQIKHQLAHLPLVNKPVPRLWKRLRENLMLEREQANYISLARFFELCPEDLENERYRLQALDYFHRIGVLLHFSEDPSLQHLVFLNPNWITDAIYAALDGKNADLENGSFQKDWIFHFWEQHKNQYSYEERGYLLQLMLKDNFDVCFSVGAGRYVVPMLLPDQKPDFEWHKNQNLGFRIQYPFMPKGIVSRLIVRLHELIKNDLAWGAGVILAHQHLGCEAKVTREIDYKTGLQFIDIDIVGASLQNQKELLGKIKDEIEHIHTTSFRNIRFTEQVLCNCPSCLSSPKPHYFPLEQIKKYVEAGKPSVECPNLMDKVSISQLLGTIYTDEKMRQFLGDGQRRHLQYRAHQQFGEHDLKEQIKQLVLKNKLVEALEILEQYFKANDENEMATDTILVKADVIRDQKSFGTGEITKEDLNVKEQRHKRTILGFLNEL